MSQPEVEMERNNALIEVTDFEAVRTMDDLIARKVAIKKLQPGKSLVKEPLSKIACLYFTGEKKAKVRNWEFKTIRSST